jgi:hypothetical protein
VKTVVDWGWPIGLGLILSGLLTHLVLDIRSDGTGKSPAPAGCFIAVVGALILFVMLCLPASYEPL